MRSARAHLIFPALLISLSCKQTSWMQNKREQMCGGHPAAPSLAGSIYSSKVL